MYYIKDSCGTRRGCSITYTSLPNDGRINTIYSETFSASHDIKEILSVVSTRTHFKQFKTSEVMGAKKPKPGGKKPGSKKGC